MKILFRIFYILLIIFGISFAALNAKEVVINAYIVKFHMPMALLIVLMLSIGVCIGYLVMTKRYWSIKRECHRLKNQVDLMERELKNLRVMPVTEDYYPRYPEQSEGSPLSGR